MKRNGFTIAEALITMAIVGVVAALTIPTFISDYRKQVYAKSLAVAVSNFETAMGAMMMKENVSNLRETEAWLQLSGGALTSSSSEDVIKKFTNKVGAVLAINNIYKKQSECYGTERIKSLYGGGSISFPNIGLLSKSGVVYWLNISSDGNVNSISETEALNRGTDLESVVGSVIIDVNGKSKPNKIARDVFMFSIGANGRIYPTGGKDLELFTGVKTYWKDSSGQNTCLDGNIKSNGIGCTARLIENGYKMDY